MAHILIIYATTDGHTRRICERLKAQINQTHTVSLATVASSPDITPYDKIVVGASIRYGKHQQSVFDFIAANQSLLDDRANAFFSVNVVARKPEKNSPDTNPYMQKFLRSTAWRPKKLAVFAGRIDYPSYRFVDRTMIRFILWMTKGPTDTTQTYEFTDWDQVDEFAQTIAQM